MSSRPSSRVPRTLMKTNTVLLARFGILFTIGLAAGCRVLRTSDLSSSQPLKMTCCIAQVDTGPYPMNRGRVGPNGEFTTVVMQGAKVVMTSSIENTSRKRITLCACEPGFSFQVRFEQPPSGDILLTPLMAGRSEGPLGCNTHQSLFRSLEPGEVMSLDRPQEFLLPLETTSIVYEASCHFARSGEEIGLHAWTGTVSASITRFPLNLKTPQHPPSCDTQKASPEK